MAAPTFNPLKDASTAAVLGPNDEELVQGRVYRNMQIVAKGLIRFPGGGAARVWVGRSQADRVATRNREPSTVPSGMGRTLSMIWIAIASAASHAIR